VARDSGLKPNIFMYSSAVSASRHDPAEVRYTRILDAKPFDCFTQSSSVPASIDDAEIRGKRIGLRK